MRLNEYAKKLWVHRYEVSMAMDFWQLFIHYLEEHGVKFSNEICYMDRSCTAIEEGKAMFIDIGKLQIGLGKKQAVVIHHHTDGLDNVSIVIFDTWVDFWVCEDNCLDWIDGKVSNPKLFEILDAALWSNGYDESLSSSKSGFDSR